MQGLGHLGKVGAMVGVQHIEELCWNSQ